MKDQKWSVSSLAHQSMMAVSSSRLRLFPLRHSVTAAVIRSAIQYTLYTICTLNIHSTSLVVWWSELLTTNHEVPGSIPGSTMEIFLVGGESPW